jgi:hypothetical protein
LSDELVEARASEPPTDALAFGGDREHRGAWGAVGGGQGLTFVHFPAQAKSFLTQTTP